ncbi:hypothetical protein M513_12305, partial [Trichuris suis]
MALPADIATDPGSELWLNGPCLTDQTTAMKLTNSGDKLIAWRVNPSVETRYVMNPQEGALPARGTIMVGIVCHPFPFRPDAPNIDTLTVEWCEAPEGQTVYDAEWFVKGLVIRRKPISVNFNP